jgi:hypothetical protein
MAVVLRGGLQILRNHILSFFNTFHSVLQHAGGGGATNGGMGLLFHLFFFSSGSLLFSTSQGRGIRVGEELLGEY